jgi:DNA-binding transcriptional LysR family regulator
MREVLPNIQVELVVTNAVSNLLQREADIALRMVQPVQSAIIAKRLGKVSIGGYAHSSYLAARGTPQTPTDLFTHDLIGFDQSNSMIEGFTQGGFAITKKQFAFRTDDFVVQWQAIRAGLGIGFIASYVAKTDALATQILPNLKLPELPVWLAVHREIQGNKRIRAVFDFLAAEVSAALQR